MMGCRLLLLQNMYPWEQANHHAIHCIVTINNKLAGRSLDSVPDPTNHGVDRFLTFRGRLGLGHSYSSPLNKLRGNLISVSVWDN